MELDARFRASIAVSKSEMTAEAEEHMTHYLEQSELEMAYESFILSCIEEKIAIDRQEAMELQSIGKALGMEKESVFDACFWSHAHLFFENTRKEK